MGFYNDLSVPVVISWSRGSDDPDDWYLAKSDTRGLLPVPVPNPGDSLGEVFITFSDPAGQPFTAFNGISVIAAASPSKPSPIPTDTRLASSTPTDTGDIQGSITSTGGNAAAPTSETASANSLSPSVQVTSSNAGTDGNSSLSPSRSGSAQSPSGVEASSLGSDSSNNRDPSTPVESSKPGNTDLGTLAGHENRAAIIAGSVLGGLSDMMVRSKSGGIGSGGTNANGSFRNGNDGGGTRGGRFGLEESKVFKFGNVARRFSVDKASYYDDDDEEGRDEVDEGTPVLPSLSKNHAAATQTLGNNVRFQVKRKPPPPLVPLRPSTPHSPIATSLYTSSHGTTVTTSSSSSSFISESEAPLSTYLVEGIHRPQLRARTDRQMFLQEQIMILRREMISITNGSKDTRCGDGDGSLGRGGESAASHLAQLWERVRQLEEWQESDWALGLTNEEPKTGGMTNATVGLGALGDRTKLVRMDDIKLLAITALPTEGKVSNDSLASYMPRKSNGPLL
ncbi:hypothetical protein K435DRAFT_797721 [Dendrothele bispora CBS 962.96]|uniref:Uncharacterized protein n=1 Tax=Dendrothele bispora (strain CBS 962.96) TaxID=1314807 RepID=A0A4S8M1H9_DENBC|nr:hypothetical protein K435DRAFT_797721 [Dendrothele bispora CBS 962.96]